MKILQLTDLHFDNSTQWKEKVLLLDQRIIDINPEIIVISGDLMDSPSKKNKDGIIKWLSQSYETLNEKPIILSIPGNHDYYFLGNRLLKRKKIWSQNERLFQKPENTPLKAAFEILKKYNIAIYPLDSNQSNMLSFAKGKVINPLKSIKTFDKYFIENINEFNPILKIAVMHHHLLPLPNYGKKDELFEPFMFLENSHEVLNAFLMNDIQVVLHGHRHTFGMASYLGQINKREKKIIVTSSRSSDPTKEDFGYSLFTLEENSELKLTAFSKIRNSEVFTNDDRSLINIKAARRNLAIDIEKYPYMKQTEVKSVFRKTKRVSINDDGNADISISYDNIRWQDNASKLIIKDFLRGGIGRIRGLWNTLYSGKVIDNPTEQPWDRREIEDHRPSPNQLEGCMVTITRENLIATEEANCEIAYQLFNGFCLNRQDYQELYYKNDKNDNQVYESCSIEANTSIELLELIITFPSKESYPPTDGFYILPWNCHLASGPNKNIVNIGERKDQVEENYLKQNLDVRFFREALQIIMTIRHPQPKITYAFRWPLMDEIAKISHDETENLNKFRETFLGTSKCVTNYYDDLVKKIVGIGNITSKLEVYLFGIDVEKSQFECSRPDRCRGTDATRLGRGAIGLAYRRRASVVFLLNSKTIDNPELELSIIKKRPSCLIAIPIVHELPNDLDGIIKPPVIAILVIVERTCGQVSNVFNHGDKDKKKEILNKFTDITMGTINNYFKDLKHIKSKNNH